MNNLKHLMETIRLELETLAEGSDKEEISNLFLEITLASKEEDFDEINRKLQLYCEKYDTQKSLASQVNTAIKFGFYS